MTTEAVRMMADKLEEHGSNRLNLQQLSQEERERLASPLVQARSQANDPDDIMWTSPIYRWNMEIKKLQFYYIAGDLGVDFNEAGYMWWSAVYDRRTPKPHKERTIV